MSVLIITIPKGVARGSIDQNEPPFNPLSFLSSVNLLVGYVQAALKARIPLLPFVFHDDLFQ